MTRYLLIGPPGSGKSTIGNSLSRRLGLPFIDTDTVIEKRIGKKISEIFIEEGEDFFRSVELEVLAEVLHEESAVISLGGGAPISTSAQELIHQSNSIVIFLDVSLATAAPRVGFNRDRPLLLGNPRAQWQSLSDVRRPIYEELATHIVKVDGMNVDEISSAIVELVK